MPVRTTTPAGADENKHKKEFKKGVSMEKKINTKLSRFERETLTQMCVDNNCDMSTLIDALMSNVVSEQLSIQIYYLKNGELPPESN